VPITNAAELASKNTGNLYVSQLVAGTSKSVYAGQPMHKGLSRHLPVDLYSLWETGEESGTLDKTSLHLAKMYEDRADLGFKILVDWLPKIFYFLVALYMIKLIARNFGMIYSGYGI
ncbi:MAG: type II secretion system F family protein, partial [Phycisphaerae bacterium]